MKKTKEKDFKTSKKRVGKEHLRKHQSKDEKLLSNLSRVKKTVKLSTQSISIKKESLNVTSRRLTFPELVGKSRHASENVRNHALLGLMEFARRYEEEGRMNVYTLLQVACASLLSEARQLRLSSRNLLLSVLSTYFSNQEASGSKCSEMVHLYLIQGLLSSNGAQDAAFADDVYTLLNLLIDRYPWLLRDYYEKLLRAMLENTPESLSFKHFNAVYSLFKLHPELDRDTRSDLVEYVVSVQYKLLTNATPVGLSEPSATKVTRRTSDKASSIRINNEIECLSNASIAVKCLKILLANAEMLKSDDQRLVDLLLNVDLYEFDSMTERGKDTFNKLFAEFALTKTELSLRLLSSATRNHLPLLVPLIQFESLKASLDPAKLVQVLFSAINLKLATRMTMHLKTEWVDRILDILADSSLNRISALKTYLHSLKARKNTFQDFNRTTSSHSNHFTDESGMEVDSDRDSTGGLESLYQEILDSSFNHVLTSPSVWPLLAFLKGVSPLVFTQLFTKSHHWAFLNETRLDPSLASAGPRGPDTPWTLKLNFEEVMNGFIPSLSATMVTTFLKLCLHLSKNDPSSGIYYNLKQIKGLGEEHYLILSRIFLNLPSTQRSVDFLAETVMEMFAHASEYALKEFHNVLLFHLFNLKSTGKLDPQGRVIINFDPKREIMDHVDYFLKFYLRLLPLAARSVGVTHAPGQGSPRERYHSEGENSRSSEDKSPFPDPLLTHALKLLIDKYLMAMCGTDNAEEPERLMQVLIEEFHRPYHEKVPEAGRQVAHGALKAVLAEYMDKDSVPEWVSSGCK